MSSNQKGYPLDKIAEVCGGEITGAGTEVMITHLLTDSRKAAHPDNSLFFALASKRDDGHRYIPEMIRRGFRYFVTHQDIELQDEKDIIIIRTSDTLTALQQLARYHRSRFSIPVIGITGSNGKTMVKEWLSQLMAEDYRIARSPKSYNSQTGVPLSVWHLGSEHELGIFEAGISLPGEMDSLATIIDPTIGVFTNIGEAHDENFENRNQKISEKLKLFSKCQALVYCRDYESIDEAVKSNTDTNLFSWSRKRKATLQVARVSRDGDYTEIQGIYNNSFTRIKIPFSDEASVENAIHCWTVMLYLGYEQQDITNRFTMLTPVEMRLEMKEGINNCSVINDSYNSDTGSLAIALDFLNQQKQHEKKTLVLSDILQSGRNEDDLYRQVAVLVQDKGVNRIIGIGEAISRQAHRFNIEKRFFQDTDQFIQAYSQEMFVNETILLKGARIFGFERISRLLQQKAHETVLEVNLTALVDNLNYFKSKLDTGTRVMAMVKAFSYGSGSFEIANILQFHRADYLAVAYADEGVELRNAGINLPIMVMNPEEQSYDVMIHYNLEPEIFSIRVLRLFVKALERNQRKLKFPYPVHLKLDTGMHRLGFEPRDLPELMMRVKNCRDLRVRSVFSHLAASDEPEHDEFTRQQIGRFREMSDEIQNMLGYPVLRHILNSAGVSRFPEAAFDMVRLGIGLYGIGTTEKEQANLRNVSTLKTTISQIKRIPPGETIGYSRRGVGSENTVIATIPIGYADGLSRKLGNGNGGVWIRGKWAPVIGNICMDMTMVDISGINAREGDEVIVFGDRYPVSEIAVTLGTIPYEIFTSISRRVKRIYFQE